ncbi:hypothetical protein ACSBR2_025262 [Camellia fascicularis]
MSLPKFVILFLEFWFLGLGFFLGFDQTTKRVGWVRRDVENPKSIDHMYQMGLMALIASDIPGVN